jgi:proline iminopeptidase
MATGFMDDGALLGGAAAALRGRVRCIAVQGCLDHICPPRTALDLHRVWPEMHLHLVAGAGHSMYDSGITSELVRATDYFRDNPLQVESEGRGL